MVQAATTNSTYEPRQFQTVPLPEAVVLQPLPPTPDPEEANKAMHDLRAALDANVAEKRAEMTLHIEGLVQKEQVAAELCFASLYCIRVEILRHYSKMQDLCNESRSLLKTVPVEEVESNADIAHVIREIGASVDQLCCLEDSHREATKRLALSDSSRRVWTAIAFMYCGLKDMQVPLHVNEVVQQIDELAGDDTTVDRARLSIVLDELVKDVAAELHRAQEANSAFASWKQVLPTVITGANESLEQWSHESRPPVLVLPLSRLKNAAEASLADADAQLEKNLVALRALRNEAKVLEEAAASSSSATSRGTASSGVAAAVSVVVDAAQDIASQVSNFAVVGWSALSSRFHDFVNTDGSVSISVGLVDEKAFKVVVENQRYYPLRGWSTSLLPTDRPRYCTLAARECPAPGDTYVLSQLERWVDEWRPVDLGAADGWLYSGDFPARGYPKVSSLTMVRRRLFARPYVVVHNGRPSVLALGEGLKQDQELRSSDGHMQLIHQRDGNVVLYFATRPLWSTKTDHRQSGTFELLPDGNLVLFSPDRKPLWASGTADRGVKALVVTDEGRVELRTANGGIVWESTATSWCGATR